MLLCTNIVFVNFLSFIAIENKVREITKHLTPSPLGNQLIDNVIFFPQNTLRKKKTNSGSDIEHYITKGSHLEQGETFLL